MISRSKKITSSMLGMALASSCAFAQPGFVAQKIKIEGLSGIGVKTVFNYLPVSEGQTISNKNTKEIIKALYKTGFFKDVKLEQRGNTLVIKVVERATIGVLTLRGNKDIPRDKLLEALESKGIKRGRIYNKAALMQLIGELKHEYSRRGKYNAIIAEEIAPLTGNRVSIKITISEGRVAAIKRINFFGNKAVSTDTLLGQMSISPSTAYTYVTKKDQFTDYELQKSLDNIKNYYQSHGYLKADISSHQVMLTPDKKHVYINIRIKEGAKYTVSGVKVVGSKLVKKLALDKKITVKKGGLFSKTDVQESITAIANALGDNGYGFPKINAVPQINEKDKTLFIRIVVDEGRTVYVRRINFVGNTKTADDVLRHIIKQDEASVLSLKKINESLRQLRIQGYLKNVTYKTNTVYGANNQVDLDFMVEEAPSAEASVAVGYGTNGPEIRAGFHQKNFMGSGKEVGIDFNASYWGENYAVTYYNPYYTKDGIGRGVNVYYQTVDPKKLDVTTFSADKLGAALNYNIPINDNSSLQLGAGLEHLKITSLGSNPATSLQNYINQFGNIYDQARLTAGFNQNTYDQMPYPTQGFSQQLSLLTALPIGDGVSYYKMSYVLRGYYPTFKGFIVSATGRIGYGNQFDNQGLPFFENFFAGGIAPMAPVRGYDTYTLGPKDSNNNAIGGNFMVSGTAQLIMPYPLSRQSVRTSAFFDIGNVYAKYTPTQYTGTKAGELRQSAGVAIDWRSPFGPLSFSLGWPLNEQPRDSLSRFQFTVTSAL